MENVPSHNARPFFDVARGIRRGAFLDEVTDAMQNVVASVTAPTRLKDGLCLDDTNIYD